MSRTSHPQPPSTPLIASAATPGPMLAWLIALLVARWLQPTEGSIEGVTLWLLPLVFLTALLRTVLVWRMGDSPGRFDVIDAVIGLLVLAQVVSALRIVFGVGDGRAAMNVAWEWVGSATLIWLLRQELRAARVTRELCVGLAMTAAVLAGYGLYQHYLGYERLIKEFNQITAEHDELESGLTTNSEKRISAADASKLRSLKELMQQQGIPADPNGRKMYENRLKKSREPLGLFALANSFSGLLVVMLLVLLGVPRLSSLWNGAVFVGAAVIGWCLILSKTRTAYAGLIVGIAWWGLRTWMNRRSGKLSSSPGPCGLEDSDRSAIPQTQVTATHKGSGYRGSMSKWIALGVLVVIAIGIVIAITGGLDKFIVTEAKKSLRYRLEYWRGTWAVILDHFWIGTGPGNFREHYLHHKLPQASEEILDPHNMLLDVWANAGVLAMFALLGSIGLMLRGWVRPQMLSSDSASAESGGIDLLSPAVWGSGLAFPLAALGQEVLSSGMDERMLSLGSVWWLIWGALFVGQRSFIDRQIDICTTAKVSGTALAIEAANVALLVHLLGAGGIAMPAITQLLWLLWFVRTDLSKNVTTEVVSRWQPSHGLLTVIASVLLGLCVSSVTWPDLLYRTQMALGDSLAGQGRDLRASQRHYLAAIEADPLAIEPLDRMAELAWEKCEATRLLEDFESAVKMRRLVIDRVPFSNTWHRRLGQIALAWFERTKDPGAAKLAAESFQSAVECYPHRADLLAEWATALASAKRNDEAARVAQQALDQDAINHKARHSDKYLPEATRRRMERFAIP